MVGSVLLFASFFLAWPPPALSPAHASRGLSLTPVHSVSETLWNSLVSDSRDTVCSWGAL